MLFQILLASSQKIEVRGNKRIEKEAIKSYVSDKIFTDPGVLNNTLKVLYETGYFKDVKLNLQNNKLVIDVIEQPIINKIAFEGNKRLKAADLKKELDIDANQAFSEFKIIEEAANKIEAIYRAIGYFNTKVVVQTRSVSEGRVDVVFKISEGRKAFIRSIKFIGNKAFDDSMLRACIESTVYSSFRFWAQDHYFAQERLQQDYMKLQEYYHNNGYPNATVTSLSSELKRDQTGFDLIFSVKEGNYFTFGDITIDYQHPQKIDIEHLKSILLVKSNKMFNKSLVDSTEEILISELGRHDISTADVEIFQQQVKSKVNIKILIKKVDKKKIRFINVRGNKRTYGKVIRDNLEIFEGNFLNRHKLKESESNLRGLNYFSKVQISPEEVLPGVYDVDINVEESPNTGSAFLQGGWGSYEGFLAQIGFTENNIGGSGKAVQGAIMVASKSLEISLSLNNPRLFDVPDLMGGVSVEWNRSKLLHDRVSNNVGLSCNIGYPLNRYFYQRWEYGIGVDSIHLNESEDDDIVDFVRVKISEKGQVPLEKRQNRRILNFEEQAELRKNPEEFMKKIFSEEDVKKINESEKQKEAIRKELDGRRQMPLKTDGEKEFYKGLMKDSKGDISLQMLQDMGSHTVIADIWLDFLKDDLGHKLNSTLTHSLIFSPVSYNPNRKFSFKIRMDNQFAGLGGSVKYLKNDFNIKHVLYLPFSSTLTTTGTIGFIGKVGDTPLRLADCKLLTGRQVHGFAEEGIGPRDIITKKNLRGTQYYWGGSELKIPIGKPTDIGINVGAYFNFGSAHKSKFTESFGESRVNDENFMRMSIGGFVSLRIPMLPLRFDWAIPIRTKHYDVEERFLVGIDM